MSPGRCQIFDKRNARQAHPGVCPEEIRTINHRKKLEDIWASPEWKAAEAAWLPGKVCIWCGRPAQVPHHSSLDDYGKPEYINLYLSGCRPMCAKCHHHLHRGEVLCPKCKERYTKQGNETCFRCLPPEMKRALRQIRRDRKDSREKFRRENDRDFRQRLKEGRYPTPTAEEVRAHPNIDRMIIDLGCHLDCPHLYECVTQKMRCAPNRVSLWTAWQKAGAMA